MPPFLIVLLTIAAAAVVLRASAGVALGVLLGAALLVPATLAVPFTNITYLTVQHVLVLAGLGRLVLGLVDRSVTREHLRLTRVHVVLVVVVLTSLIVGVGATDPGEPVRGALTRAFDLVDQLAVFVVLLALLRQQADVRAAARVAALVTVLACAVAVAEHVSGQALGEFLFRRLPSQLPTPAGTPLNPRGGEVRVRAGAEFALQFGWLVAMLLPLVVATALLVRRRGLQLAAAGALLGVLAVYWSFTRSALAASVVVLLLMAVLARRRELLVPAASLAVVAGGAYLALAPVRRHLGVSTDAGSLDVRQLRLAPILDLVSHHPFRGLGLGGLGTSGLRVTDNAYLLQYLELGAIGVALLALLLLVSTGESVRSLWIAAPEERLIAAACVSGVAAYIASGATYDAFTLIQGTHVLWFLVALAIVLAELHLPPAPATQRAVLTVAGVGLATAGAMVGLVLLLLAPTHEAQRYVVTTLPADVDTRPDDDFVDGGRAIDTACLGLESIELSGVSIDCIDPSRGAGQLYLRIEATSGGRLEAARDRYTAALRTSLLLPSAQLFPLDTPRVGKSSWARTGPVWIPALMIALFVELGRGLRAADRRTS